MFNSREIIKKNRFLIIGAPGSGKTSLARRLGPILNLDVFHLDSFFWKPGWEKVAHLKRTNILNSIMKNDKWIIEGNYPDMLELQIKYADVIIVLEFSRLLCYWRVMKRKFNSIIRPLPDIASGCPDTIDRRFLMSIWDYPLKDVPIIERALLEVDENILVIKFSRTSSVNKFIDFVESLFNTK